MANKKVQNEVTQKEVQKKGRRLKRSVRKTFGALFLASAIAVAAIPTDGLQAAVDPTNTGTPVSVNVFESGIPHVVETATIYMYPIEYPGTNNSVTFRFAYVSMNNGQENGDDRVAVILGYTQIGNLPGGVLRIPDTVEAYKRYSVSETDAVNSSVAVDMDGKFLYYRRVEPKVDETGQPVFIKASEVDTPDPSRIDEEGYYLTAPKAQGGQRIQATQNVYYPCKYTERDEWADDSGFYVRKDENVGDTDNDYDDRKPTERIANAVVGYIGSQYLQQDDDTGDWKIVDDVDDMKNGVFAGSSNITTLEIGDDVMGIGNYAFANCGFTNVSFGNGLRCVGNYAFAGCQRLKEVGFDLSCGVDTIGAFCFSGCSALPSIDLPGNVTQLGDCAFEDCTSLEAVNIIHPDKNYDGNLNKLGRSVFKGCSSLKSIEFPKSYTGTVDVSEFEGCTSLAYIKANNATFDLKDEDLASFKFNSTGENKGFKQTVPSTFYLEGPEIAALHKKAQEQRIAYRFNSSDFGDIYELIVDDGDWETLYQVTTPDGKIVKCDMDDNQDTITLPETLGPQTIVGIDVPTFQNKCFLKTITIPASVSYIAEDAFRGCHRLENVIFTDAEKCTTIGDGAFSTQEILDINHEPGCGGIQGKDSYLNFVGTISPKSRPFTYAMSPGEYINNGSMYRTYITYYSGWPTNLAVRYNETTGLNELIDYPTLTDIRDQKYTNKKYVYITEAYETAAGSAYTAYLNNNMDDYQKALINATLDIVLPDGIESIAYVDAEGNPVAVILDNEGNIVDDEGTVSSGDRDSSIKGLFSYKEEKENNELPKKIAKTLTAYSIQKIGESAFKNCDNIAAVSFSGPLTAVGNYAFEDCDLLNSVSLAESLKEMGLRPFTDCEDLLNVNFNGSETFSCVDSIIYKSGSGGKTLVEYLYGRKADVEADELVGVTAIYPEAFMRTRVYNVDFTNSSITNVPQNAFRETVGLNEVILPEGCLSISIDAFTDSHIMRLHIPGRYTIVHNDAMRNINKESPYTDMTDLGELIIYTPVGSVASVWADENGVEWREKYVPVNHTVAFYDDWEHMYELDHLIAEVLVEDGHDGETAYKRAGLDLPTKEGYIFDRWSQPVNNVTNDMVTGAVYKEIDTTITVTFYDRNFDDTESISYNVYRVDENIPYGGSVPIPSSPTHEGYTFIGWLNGIVNKDKPGYMGPFTKDTQIYAQYEKGDSQNGSGSGGDGTGNGGTGNGNGNGGGGSGSDGNGSGGSGSGNFYILTVQNGSGSGSYPEGSQPVIIANDPASGQVFDHWTVSPADVKIASTVLSASIITMPASDVTVTAHYKAGSSSSSGGGTTGSGNNSQRPSSGSGTVTNGGTTVVIDKNGLSNTGVVSATVNGSSDNFTIKITESNAATEAALRALMAEYGNLDNIKYFPMDISLYDSTGTYKITDTTGISVTITLPLPDSLITYAGNNRVASVVNDRLERLSARFTTIQGVSCITFTAEHFSPYVIYVNTGDLSSGEVSDSTPKTGDFIHPKWFLSIALACMSFVLFMQKDARKPKKVKVKVKAR